MTKQYLQVQPPLPKDCVHTEIASLYLGVAEGEKLSFADAAEQVLRAVHGGPMHYVEITRHALEHALIETKGLTPWATMYAQILTECKRRERRGEEPRFMMLGRGMIGLASGRDTSLVAQIEESNRKARNSLLAQIRMMSPSAFEDLVGRLLAAIGFEEVEVTARSRDGGIDVRGTLVIGGAIKTRLAVQVKRWRQNIQSPVIRQVRGSLGAHEQGLVITTSDFSKGAREQAERADVKPVGLMNGEQLVALMVENGIGARRTPVQLIEVGEADPVATPSQRAN